MITSTINQSASVGGLSIQGNVKRDGDSQLGHSSDPALAKALAGTLSSRVAADEGEFTLAEGHGFEVGDVIDVYWSSGIRYGMVVSAVDTTTVTAGGVAGAGGGDDLPAEGSTVQVSLTTEASFQFSGDDIKLIAAACAQRAHVVFLDVSDNVLLAVELPAREVWSWADAQGSVNPLAADAVDSIRISNGDTATAAVMKVGVLLNVHS